MDDELFETYDPAEGYFSSSNDGRSSAFSSKAEEYVRQYSSVPFYGQTTNNTHYPQYETKPVERVTANDFEQSFNDRDNVPFYGETTNQAEYTNKHVPLPDDEPRLRQRPSDDDYIIRYRDVPFYGDTTNRTEYSRKETPRPERRRRPSDELVSLGSLTARSSAETGEESEGEEEQTSIVTTNVSEYGPKTAERSSNYKPKSRSLFGIEPFDANTTNRAEFVAKKVERTNSYRPVSDGLFGDRGFDDLTTHRQTYGPKKAASERALSFRPKRTSPFAATENAFDGRTTAAADFQPKSAAIPRSFKPKSQNVLGGLQQPQLAMQTVHMSDFAPKTLVRTTSYKPPETRVTIGDPSAGLGLSTTTDDFQPWRAKRTPAVKPHPDSLSVSGQFDYLTTNRDDYGPKRRLTPCPAEQLLNNAQETTRKFRHTHKTGGHYYYEETDKLNLDKLAPSSAEGRLVTRNHLATLVG